MVLLTILPFIQEKNYYSLNDVVKKINQYNNDKNNAQDLIDYANLYKAKNRIDLARIIYIVLDNTNMLHMMDIKEGKDIYYTDLEISNIIRNNANLLDNDDIMAITSTGYFDRKTKALEDKIKGMKIEVIK